MCKKIDFLQNEMLNNLQYQWTIEKLTEISGLSVRYLQKMFKTKTGFPPISWLREKRLEKAKELIENTKLNIGEISYKVGMFDESHFTRDFKAKFDKTPTAWRDDFLFNQTK